MPLLMCFFFVGHFGFSKCLFPQVDSAWTNTVQKPELVFQWNSSCTKIKSIELKWQQNVLTSTSPGKSTVREKCFSTVTQQS